MLKKVLLFAFCVSSSMAMSNLDVAINADKVMSGYKDAKSSMKMTLINSSGDTSIRTMKMQILEKPDGDKSLMTFLTPRDVKGTKFLSYEHINKDDDQWLYLPALKRVKRIASRNKSGSFMGSEFSYEDLASFNMKKYNYSGDANLEKLDGHDVYVGTRTPKSKNSAYSKQISYIDTKSFLVQKVEYYDTKKRLLKVSTFDDYIKIDGVWRVGKISMKNVQNDKGTILVWSDQKIKTGLKDKDFHKRVLKR